MSKRSYLEAAWPPWTRDQNHPTADPNYEQLSLPCKRGLISIHSRFTHVNELLLQYIRNVRQEIKDRYTLDDERTLHLVVKGARSSLAESQKRMDETISILVDNSYLHIWTRTVTFLLLQQHNAHNYHSYNWKIGKAHAASVLKICDLALGVFFDIEDELLDGGFQQLRDALQDKLDSLMSFRQVYDRQPPAGAPAEHIWVFPERSFKQRVEVYNQSYQKRHSTITAVLCSTVAINIVPLAYAWKLSDRTQPGTTLDADFYTTITNATMQLLGLFVATYQLYPEWLPLADWLWTWIFAIGAAMLSLASIPAYLLLPTIWSTFASYLGSVGQVYMAVQLAIRIPGLAPKAEKRD